MKTYTAASGYVYHYYYLGQRPFRQGRVEGTEYVFEASPDRRTWRQLSVFLPEIAMASREARLGRGLIAAERYAISKLTLFQAFDERPEARGDLHVREADLDGILETLGIE